MPDWSWVQSVLEWMKFVPDWVWTTAWTLVSVIIGFLANNLVAPRWKEIRKIEAQIERQPELAKKIEEVRSDIGMLREELTSIRKQGRDAVVSFLEKSDVFLHEFSESVRLVRENKGQDFLDNHLHTLEKHIADLGFAQTRLFAYFHEERNIVEAGKAVLLSARESSTALRRQAAEILSRRWTFKNIDTLIPENQRTTITPEYLRSAMANNAIKKEKELYAEIEASHEKFSLTVAEFTEKTSRFFEQIYLKSENRS